MVPMTGSSVRPKSASEYTTRGGTWAKTSRLAKDGRDRRINSVSRYAFPSQTNEPESETRRDAGQDASHQRPELSAAVSRAARAQRVAKLHEVDEGAQRRRHPRSAGIIEVEARQQLVVIRQHPYQFTAFEIGGNEVF